MNRTTTYLAPIFGFLLLLVTIPNSAAVVSVVQTTTQFKAVPVEPNWARYPASCQHPSLMSCGSLGKFQLKQLSAVPGCTPVQSGRASLSAYPRQIPPSGPTFPPTTPYSYLQSSVFTNFSSSTSSYHSSASASSDAIEAGQDWIAVVDFDDSHGWSTRFLAGEIAGPEFEAMLVPLELDASDPLGNVTNDFHVLRALCSIAEEVEQPGVSAPAVINMSFGRTHPPAESWYSAACTSPRFGCQIAQVLGELAAQGTRIVGAAGNHGEMLFPAGLPGVTAVGMLDLHSLRYGTELEPAWQSPAGTEAILPGGQLCLDGDWSAPAGTSYSSAMFAGWLASVVDQLPSEDPPRNSPWMPEWDAGLNCYVVTDGASPIRECNVPLTEHIQRLDGALENPCWETVAGPKVTVDSQNGASPPVGLPSFDHWAETIMPTPSGDPCVPCVGLQRDPGLPEEVLEINLSQSPGLHPSVYIAAVYLKSASGFEEIFLSPAELSALRAGTLSQLDLEQFPLNVPELAQPSLWYLLSTEPDPDCDGGSLCFWDSSSILVELAGP